MGDHLLTESAENRYRTYLYEPDSFHPLAMLDGEGPLKAAPFYYHLDHLGTPQELTDYSGEIMWSAKYRAYGNLAALDVAEIDNPLRFQGQYFDAETGLHYNRHRYYNPGTGRFLTPDPIKLAGGLNSYQYVPNPTGWVDPLGLSTNCPGKTKNGTKRKPDDTSSSKVEANEVELPKGHDSTLTRKAAFRQAKKVGGVPLSQQPSTSYKEVLTDQKGRVMSRVYEFHLKDGRTVTIREHSLGHVKGNEGPHFNTEVTGTTGTKAALKEGDNSHTYFKKGRP